MRIHSILVVAALLPAAALALPRGVQPMRAPRAEQSQMIGTISRAAAPANALLNYYGGHVLSNVHIVPVLWGANVPSEVANGIGPYYAAIADSTYFDWLAEYDTDLTAFGGETGTGQHIGRGTAEATITIHPSMISTSITNDQIVSELQAQINAGHLPRNNANSLYMFHFPAGMKITMPDGNGGTAGSCTQFCAYHNTIAASPVNIFYGVMPNVTSDGCEAGCGPIGGGFNNTTSVASHELIETVTDAEVGLAQNSAPPLAWYDPQGSNGEIGDICNGDQGTVSSHGQSWTVQNEYSNSKGTCIASSQAHDFALRIAPGNLALAAGASVKYSVTAVGIGGGAGTITLDSSGFPAGLTASLNKTSISIGDTATLTVSATTAAANGAAVFSIHGTASGITNRAKGTATVSGGGTGGGGPGTCPAGTINVGGVCVPIPAGGGGCSTTGSSWLALLGLGAVLFARRSRRQHSSASHSIR